MMALSYFTGWLGGWTGGRTGEWGVNFFKTITSSASAKARDEARAELGNTFVV